MNPQTAPKIAQALRSTPRALAQRFEMFYSYTLSSALTVAKAATQASQLTTQADYDFAVYALGILIYDQATSAVILPANSTATVQINDTGAGANWFSNPVGVSTVFGSAQLPFQMPVIRIVARTATLSFSFTNLADGTSATGALYLPVLIGTKLATSNQGQLGIAG